MAEKIVRVTEDELLALTHAQMAHTLVWLYGYLDESRKSGRLTGPLYDKAFRLAVENAIESPIG